MRTILILFSILLASNAYCENIDINKYFTNEEDLKCRLVLIAAVNSSNMKIAGEKWFKDDPFKHALFDLKDVTCKNQREYAKKIAEMQTIWFGWKKYQENH